MRVHPPHQLADPVNKLRNVVGTALTGAVQEEDERDATSILRHLLGQAVAEHIPSSANELLGLGALLDVTQAVGFRFHRECATCSRYGCDNDKLLVHGEFPCYESLLL